MDFDYTLPKSNESFASSSSYLPSDDITKPTQLEIFPKTLDFFNILVCRTLDWQAFPAAPNGNFCGCSDKGAIGGMPASTALFKDNVRSAIMKSISQQGQQNCIQNYSEQSPTCTGGCHNDIYSG